VLRSVTLFNANLCNPDRRVSVGQGSNDTAEETPVTTAVPGKKIINHRCVHCTGSIVVIFIFNDLMKYTSMGIKLVIVRPLSAVGYTSVVASVIHSRQWSNYLNSGPL